MIRKAWRVQFSPDNPKLVAVKNCTSNAFRITHELSFNFISKLKRMYYDVLIFITIRDFRYYVCSVEYGIRITLPVFHIFLPYHTEI